jgi:hypothetical protein
MVPLTWEERLFGMSLLGKLPTAINPERRNCEVMILGQFGSYLMDHQPHSSGKFNNTTPVYKADAESEEGIARLAAIGLLLRSDADSWWGKQPMFRVRVQGRILTIRK